MTLFIAYFSLDLGLQNTDFDEVTGLSVFGHR
jgi:hypothetical protein